MNGLLKMFITFVTATLILLDQVAYIGACFSHLQQILLGHQSHIRLLYLVV